MSPISNNEAAWIPYEKAPAMEVGPGPVPNPAENELVIEVAYAAINPVDWKLQTSPPAIFPLPYPMIFGSDIAGIVVQLGAAVTRFTIGQRVMAHCDSLETLKISNAGFQRFSTCQEILVAAIPDSLSLASAAVLPLGFSTAATGWYKTLGMRPFPTLKPIPTGKTVLVWGGSSSVGSSAIQLAVASGYTVVTTVGAHNQEYAKALGATHTIDHNSLAVVHTLLKLLKPGDLVFDCIGSAASQLPCAEIVAALGGGIVACVLPPVSHTFPNTAIVYVHGLDLVITHPEIAAATWAKFLPEVLAAGMFKAKPDPKIITGGLTKVQEAVDVLKRGVSATKVVVEIAKMA